MDKRTERNCSKHHNTICDKTKCTYGPRFLRTDVSMTVSAAEVKYGKKAWKNLPHEMTTTVMHDSRDSNGSNFHCGHVRYTKDQCRCFCSNKGGNQIWHHAPRYASHMASGKTSAGCTCKSSWKWYGKTYKGCANPTQRIDRGEERHSDWCMVVPGSCEKETQHKARVPAGQNWDVCETVSTFKLKLHF